MLLTMAVYVFHLLPAADDIYGYLSQQATDEFSCHNLALEE